MKYVIVSGSFKDVFDPIEACDMIEEAISSNDEIIKIPFCDGGEYTLEVLQNAKKFDTVYVEGILNPYLKPKRARYLTTGKQAHIISSEILRLYPDEDEKKNPLELTDYGYGQLIKHAICSGYKEIYLYIGGTSTVCGGIGCAQALGIDFYNKEGSLMKAPIMGKDLIDIGHFEVRDVACKDLEIHIIADGDAKLYEMQGITKLKIGKIYNSQSDVIVKKIEEGIKNITKICSVNENQSFSGAAGALLIGIELCFEPDYTLGGKFFSEMFQITDAIRNCDCVLTGEGRYDNTACGKAPAFVAGIAKQLHKQVILVCGQIDTKICMDEAGGIIKADKKNALLDNGIDMILTCQFFYDQFPPKGAYEENVQYYKENTVKIIKKLFQRVKSEIVA